MPESEDPNNSPSSPAAQSPGTVISPSSNSPVPTPPEPPVTETPEPTPPAQVPTNQPEQLPATEQPQQSVLEQDTYVDQVEPEDMDFTSEAVAWTASEFVSHDKSYLWYLTLAIGAAIFAAVIFLLTKDLISSIVVIVAALILGVYGSHKPRELEYRISQYGFTIGPKHYSFDEFKTFSVMQDGAFSSISFMPLKRFSPVITIYYPPEDEPRLIAILSKSLPYEEARRDLVDSLMRRMRF